MLKRLAAKYLPMAMLFVLVVAIVCMSRYAETRKENHQDNANHINPATTIAADQAAKGAKEADKAKDPPRWIKTFTWPDGVTAWALLLTLFVIAWQSTETRDAAQASRASIRVQEAAMQQWVDVEPRGVEVITGWRPGRKPFEIRLQFEAVNNTPFLLTIQKTVTTISLWAGHSETSTVDVGGSLPPCRNGKSGGHPFYIETGIETKEGFERGTLFTINGEITFRDCLGKIQEQWFGGLYECAPGHFERLSVSGVVPDKQENDQRPNPN